MDALGDPTVDCKGLYCLAADAPTGPGLEYYCSRVCNPDAAEPCAGGAADMVCDERITQPKAGSWAANAAGISLCQKDQDCGPCGISDECVGDRACVNLGPDSATLADYRCVAGCTPGGNECGAGSCNASTDALGVETWGCFEVTGPTPVNHCIQ